MTRHRPAQTAGRRTRSTILAVVVVVIAIAGIVGCRSLAGSSSPAVSSIAAERSAHRSLDAPDHPPGRPLGVADGEVPDGVTVFDDAYPAVANLDPALLGALREAATDAGRDGVELYVNSGWRSAGYQERLLAEAVSEYGSRAEAARWVATTTTSPHVSGDAVDIGETDATTWLSQHGAEYGLCRVYVNEPWHYELRTDAVEHGCPPLYADPTDDPRMQQ